MNPNQDPNPPKLRSAVVRSPTETWQRRPNGVTIPSLITVSQLARSALWMAASLLMASPAWAETLGGAVRDHAEEHVSPGKPKKKRTTRRPSSDVPSPRPTPARARETTPRKDPAVLRVIGADLQLDPQIGAGYQGWYAQQYPTVEVTNQSYATWAVQLKAKLFRLVSLDRGYYESNGVSAPRHAGASVAAQVGSFVPKSARLLGIFGLDLDYVVEPIVRYETRAHETTATPERPVRLIPRSARSSQQNTEFPLTMQPLTMISTYETFIVAGRYNPSNGSKIGLPGDVPPAYLGVGLIQFGKPYQFNVRDAVLDEFVFDARFRGVGMAMGFTTPTLPDRFHVDFAGMVGLGQVRLLSDLTLNEVVANDMYIGFAQGNLTVGYLYPLRRSRPMLLLGLDGTVGGATFFFWKTQYHEDEDIDLPALNWDVIWGTQAYVVVPL